MTSQRKMAGSTRARKRSTSQSYSYDVCLSFAGEDRAYVRKVAERLKKSGLTVFFDEFEESNLWGRDLYEYLDGIYSKASRYCVVFCSKKYAKKLWTNHERRSAQERAFRENVSYLLPVRFDQTEIPGIRSTTGYIDLRRTSPDQLAALIRTKVGPSKLIEMNRRVNFFPPDTDLLYARLGITNPEKQEICRVIASSFYKSLSYMRLDERSSLLPIFLFGCRHDLPRNKHIDLDLLRRVTGLPVETLKANLKGLNSIGFDVKFPRGKGGLVTVIWTCRSSNPNVIAQAKEHTGIADLMIDIVSENYCSTHGLEMLMNLNFSALSSSTYVSC